MHNKIIKFSALFSSLLHYKLRSSTNSPPFICFFPFSYLLSSTHSKRKMERQKSTFRCNSPCNHHHSASYTLVYSQCRCVAFSCTSYINTYTQPANANEKEEDKTWNSQLSRFSPKNGVDCCKSLHILFFSFLTFFLRGILNWVLGI